MARMESLFYHLCHFSPFCPFISIFCHLCHFLPFLPFLIILQLLQIYYLPIIVLQLMV